MSSVLRCGFLFHPLDSHHRLRLAAAVGEHFVRWAAAAAQPEPRRGDGSFCYEAYLDRLGELADPMVIGHIDGLASPAGPRVRAIVVGVPLLPRQFVSLPEATLVGKLVAAARLLEERGAQMVGLGAYTAAMGLGYRAAPDIEVGLTSGNALTAYATVVGTRRALAQTGRTLDGCTACVVGANGSVGHGVTDYLAHETGCRIVLCGRHAGRLQKVAGKLGVDPARLVIETDLAAALAQAEVVVTATSHGEPFIDAALFRKDAVVCDSARPPDVIASTVQQRPDVIIFDGGLVDLPGKVALEVPSSALPEHGIGYACFAETVLLTMAGIHGDFALGQVTAADMKKVATLADQHGFTVSSFKWGDQVVLPREARA